MTLLVDRRALWMYRENTLDMTFAMISSVCRYERSVWGFDWLAGDLNQVHG